MRERKPRARKKDQYNEFGELVYQVGPIAGGDMEDKGDQVCAVEIKPSKSQALKRNQIIIMGALSAKGIRCFLWSPDGGFEEVMGMTSQPKLPF